MGSLEAALTLKRGPALRSSPSLATGSRPFFHRPRSRLARFLLFEKVDYLQWVFTVAAFFLVVVLFQAFLPGSVVEKPGRALEGGSLDGGLGELEFGEGIEFVPTKLLERWERERRERNSSLAALGRAVQRVGIRKPRLAMVVANLLPDAPQLQMVSIAAALQEIGYEIQVFSFEDGPAHGIWRAIGVAIDILPTSMKEMTVDWLNYNGILVSSLEGRPVISCLLQEPFKSIPVIWTLHEKSLALRLSQYATNGWAQLIDGWKQVFNRATVIVFSNYLLPMMYSALDGGNYFVIPGSPAAALGADAFSALHSGHDLRNSLGFQSEDFVIVIAGSQFWYSGIWLEHALVLQALPPLLKQFLSENNSYSRLRVSILNGNSTSAYKMAIEAVALNAGYPRGTVEHTTVDEDMINFLSIADLVIYGSFLEEQAFPSVLTQAMSLGKLVIAPDLGMIRKYVVDKVNGYLFPKENVGMLTQVLLQAVRNGKITHSSQKIALMGKEHARNLMASESIEGYASLLENVIKFPSEVTSPRITEEIPSKLKEQWQWHMFESIRDIYLNSSFRSYKMLDRLEEEWLQHQMETSANTASKADQVFSSIAWEEEKKIEMVNTRRRLEEEELKDRSDQPHGSWEEVYRNVKRADRARNELHERDDRELERTGQPLCIYEPYFGEGTWPFLHRTSLYRGIGFTFRGRRPGFDDIDASSRLPLLNSGYYRDVLGEYGAFFALANRIDRIHRNAWIGFQSWRASARKASLSKKAEAVILEDIQARRHGDAFYFWVRMDRDPRNPEHLDFWTFCDAINAGNCRFAVSEALRRMYGLQHDWKSLPQMPNDGNTWSVMQSWVLPTRSFLEFVMFSRMFVDALDAQMYDEHHRTGNCYLSPYKDRHCYSRVLELLVNVWAFHSARRMVYVNPETGAMQEQHSLKSRKGQMWVRWFSYATLKSMDEDLAEESDADQPDRRWLWPATGEVFWQGIYDRERNMRQQQKERRKQQSKDKIQRIKKRARQKTLGKFIKPQPDDTGDLNSTRTS